MTQLLILYASQTETGRVRRLVDTAATAASREPGVTVRTLRADQAGPDDVLAAQGLLLVTPEHFGYMAGKLKDFFDRCFYPLEGRTAGWPYALIVTAGNDGRGTVTAVERIITGLRWKAVAPARIIVGEPTAAALEAVDETSLGLAAGLALNAF